MENINTETTTHTVSEESVEIQPNSTVEIYPVNGTDYVEEDDNTDMYVEVATEEIAVEEQEQVDAEEDNDLDLEEVDLDELEAMLDASDEEGDTPRDVTGKPAGAASGRLVQLPLARVRQIIKLDPDVDRVNGDAVFIITKATEMFLEMFAKEVYKFTARSKKKTVQMRDITACIDDVCAMQFLDGVFPPS